MQETINGILKKNIKDVRSQKLKQQPMNINSRNELIERNIEPKGIAPLKNFEFAFVHESQDDFIDGSKKLHMQSKDEKFYNHTISIGPVH